MNIFNQIIIRPTMIKLMLMLTLLTSQHTIANAENPSANNFMNALLGQHKALNKELLNNHR